jgi:hypothetical protein
MILATGIIYGPPRTKKTHSRIVRAGKFPKLLPSEAYEAWNKAALLQLLLQFRGWKPLARPVNCRAIFYRDCATGDAVGYYQALADTLENAHIVENDKYIVSWDGSRTDKDAKNPRVVFTLEATDAV